MNTPGVLPPRTEPPPDDKAQKNKTLFTEEDEEGFENLENIEGSGETKSSGGVLIAITINILLIVSFLMEFKISDASNMSFAIESEFDEYPISTDPLMFLSDLSKMQEAVFFVENVVFNNVLNPNRTYTPLAYSTFINNPVNLTWYLSANTSGSRRILESSSSISPDISFDSETADGADDGDFDYANTGSSVNNNGTFEEQANGKINKDKIRVRRFEDWMKSNKTSRNLQDDDDDDWDWWEEEEEEEEDYVPPGDEDYSSLFYSSESSYYFLNSFNLFKGMLIRVKYDDNYDYIGDMPSEAFISTTMSQQEAKDAIATIEAWLEEGVVVDFQMHTIFFNVITQVGLYVDLKLTQGYQTSFKAVKTVKPFFPKTFDSDYEDTNAKVMILIFRCLFGLSLLFRIIKVIIIDLYKAVKTFFQTRKLDLSSSLIFNIIVIGLLVLVLVLSVYNSINTAGTFETFDSINQTQFEKFMGFANFLYIFVRFIAVIIGLLVVQILLMLNTLFPTFGVLFYTLNNSKNKLLIFGALIVTIIAAFVSFMTINFGPYNEEMSGLGTSILLIFEYMIGVIDLESLKASNEPIAYVFFFLFYTLFNFVILVLFIVIIIGTYVHLRKKLQLTTLALAELAAEKSNKLKEKYINLILFRAADEENADDEQPPPTTHAGGKNPRRAPKKKRNLMEILLYNLEEVDWFGLTNTSRQTRDQIEEEIKNKIIEIKIRRENQKKKKMEDRRKGLFDKIANMAAYLVFIVIYTYTMTYQLKIEQAYDINTTLENYYIKSSFISTSGLNKTFYDISTIEDVVLWTKNAYFGRIFNGFTKASTNTTKLLQPYNQNAISSTLVSRVTIRELKTQVKTDSSGTHSFTVRLPVDLDDTTKYSTKETISDLISSDGILNQLYTFSGSYETFRKRGGYVWAITRDLITARNSTAQIMHPKVINFNTGLVAFQTVYYSRNYELSGLCEFVLKIRSTGEVVKYYKTKSFQVDLQHCQGCVAEIIFEVIYLLLILKQTYDIVVKWRAEWLKTSKLTPVKEEYRNKQFIVRLLNYDIEEFKFFPFMLQLLTRIWQFINRAIRTTLNLFQLDYANLVIALSLILTYISFYFYFSFIFNSFRSSFNTKVSFSTLQGNVSQLEEIGRFEEIGRLIESYTLVQAFNSWLIILRILFTYGFSKELSLVLELIYEALFDIVFFVAMFILILIGFAIDGYLIFGAQTETFSGLTESFLQTLLMMITGDFPDDLDLVDNVTRAVYYILLIVLCLLILLKMFLAILDGQFTEMTAESNFNDNLGVIELIISVVIEKVKEAKFDEDYETVPEGAGKFTRLRIASLNKLKEYRLKILNTLRRIIFGPEEHVQLVQSPETATIEGGERRKLEIDIKFDEKPEERKQDLEEIKIYLEDKLHTESPLIEGEPPKDEFGIPSKWMGALEDSVVRISNNQVKFAKYGTGAKDYLSLETDTDSDLTLKLNEVEKKCNIDRPTTIPLTDYYVEYVATSDFKTNLSKKFKGQVYYEKLMDHIKFLYYKSLKETPEEDRSQEEESIIQVEEEEQLDPSSAKRLHKNAGENRKPTIVKETQAYREASFYDPNENLLKFWNLLKFSHKFELWAGDRADLLSNDIRHVLWEQMKFEGTTFGPFVPKDEFEKFEDKELKADKIGMSELEYIWNSSKIPLDSRTRDKPLLKQGASIKGLTTEHTDLIEYIIRNDMNNIIFELRKFETTKEKIKFLESLKNVKHDHKLMLWLLMSPQSKIELALRIKNPILAEFTMLLLMEEVYDNIYLLEKIEKDLDVEMQNRVYMHFLYFANYEASQHSMSNHRQDYLPDDNPDILEYIHFLESQLDSTNKAKAKCLEQVQKIVKVEEAKRSELEISRNDDSYLRNMAKFATGGTNEEERSLLLKHEVSNKSALAIGKDPQSARGEKDESKIEDESELRNSFKNFKTKDPTNF